MHYHPRHQDVKRIALYLRKSRDEEGLGVEILNRHEERLMSFLEPNLKPPFNREIVGVYKEVGSSDTIRDRPEFCRLMDDMDLGILDAVVAVDLDRITRGSRKEYGIICDCFEQNDVLHITTSRTYDLNEDDILIDIEHRISRSELKKITRRLSEGKKDSAREGRYSNGSAPYGYRYNRLERMLEIRT
ncbi:recombinase family protein [Peribacillus tepidiphilus]|uniref:recombinase family protein n=1 Tax=Peribacillus tepidiphilus TaxID=2652445 RepID=UPI001291E4E0|nr:recombinase family protein [Peribacillus tepidiphilus]